MIKRTQKLKRSTTRIWSRVHKWSSIVCSLFLFMLCLTGLPLIFHDEIDAALNSGAWQPANPGGPYLDLDELLVVALDQRPGEVPVYMSFDIDRPVVNITSGPTADAPLSDLHFASFDRTSGNPVPVEDRGGKVMHFLLQLHTDLFLGLPGMLFLGFMGLLLVLSIVSGVILYAPFMRRLDFGTVRKDRTRHIKHLDWHNLVGIVTVAWLSVVGLTGTINTLEEPIIDTWKYHELSDLASPFDGFAPPANFASLDTAVSHAVEAAPDMKLQFVAFPGSNFSTRFHFAVFLHGSKPATEHIITPALVEAETGVFAGLREMPWWVKALSLSRPLHFGDYGGMFLKIVWALLDILTLHLLATGLYLWFGKRRKPVELLAPTAYPDIV